VALRLTDEPETAGVDDFASVRGPHHDRRAELESVRSRRARRQQFADATPQAVDDVIAAVGERALVEYVVVGDRIDGLVVHRGRVRHHVGLADVAEMRAGVDRLLFGLRRMVDPSAARAAAASELVAGIGASLDRLLAPIPAGVDDIVLVPTGPLHRLPWSTLPGARGRSIVLAPSARLWARPLAPHNAPAGVALVAGPDVPEAAAEIEALHAVHAGRADRVSAEVESVRAAFGTGRLVHIAAHGVFRNDNPQFSRLQLEDGPLFVHDLDGLASLPRTVILSACSVGAVGVLDGDEVLGFPAALLARGAGSVVAAVVPVEDGAAHDLMVELHRRLQRGDAVSAALAAAAEIVRPRSARHQAAADSFVVYGRGG
jgi:CHAT domain-containing protein